MIIAKTKLNFKTIDLLFFDSILCRNVSSLNSLRKERKKKRLLIKYRMFCNNYGELAKFAWISRSINIFAAAADISLALVLIYLLQRSRTGYKQTDTIIMRLTIFTFTTGFSVSFCALLTLITVRRLFRFSFPVKGKHGRICLILRLVFEIHSLLSTFRIWFSRIHSFT